MKEKRALSRNKCWIDLAWMGCVHSVQVLSRGVISAQLTARPQLLWSRFHFAFRIVSHSIRAFTVFPLTFPLFNAASAFFATPRATAT